MAWAPTEKQGWPGGVPSNVVDYAAAVFRQSRSGTAIPVVMYVANAAS